MLCTKAVLWLTAGGFLLNYAANVGTRSKRIQSRYQVELLCPASFVGSDRKSAFLTKKLGTFEKKVWTSQM